MKHVMLDLETMGLGTNAAIIAIGAVQFDLNSGELGEKFYSAIDLASSVEFDGVMDASTVLWWMKQDKDAKKVFTEPSVHILSALNDFSAWLHTIQLANGVISLWGNGADFDNVILAETYKNCSLETPWAYHQNCCFKTIKKQYKKPNVTNVGTHHNALDDAIYQANYLIKLQELYKFNQVD